MSPKEDQVPPPTKGSSPNTSPPPLWEDAVKGGMDYRLKSGNTYEYRCKSYLGHFAVKLGLTILILQVLEGHTMTCLDATRKMLSSFDTISTMLTRSSHKGITILDFFWAWDDLYTKYTLDIFVRILGTFYGQVWGPVREHLENKGFQDLPNELKAPLLRYRSLVELLAAYPASEGPSTPFTIEHGRVKIIIPARPPSSDSTANTTNITLSIATEEIPAIRYDSLSEEERTRLRVYLVHEARVAISHRDDTKKSWNLFGAGSKKREISISEKELQVKAWVGDAMLHRVSREVLVEIRPALPMGCIKAVANTFNSNPVQAAFARQCGWYKDPPHLSRVEADHLGGTFVEGESCLSFEANCRDSMASAKMWVKGGVECVAQPLVQGFKRFFEGSAGSGHLNPIQTLNTTIFSSMSSTIFSPMSSTSFIPCNSMPLRPRPKNRNIRASRSLSLMSTANNLSSQPQPRSTGSMPKPRETITTPLPRPSPLSPPSSYSTPSPSSASLPPRPHRSCCLLTPPRVKRVFSEVDTNTEHPAKLQTKRKTEGSGSHLSDGRASKRAREQH